MQASQGIFRGQKRELLISPKNGAEALPLRCFFLFFKYLPYRYKFLKNTCKKNALCSIIDKHEYRKLMDFVRKTDPKAFVTVYSVSEMRYQPKIKK